MNGRPWTADDDERLRRLVASGMTDGEVGERMGRHRDMIWRKRQALGLVPGVSPALTMMMARMNARRFRLQNQSRSYD